MKKLINTILKASSLFLVLAVIHTTGCQQQAPDYSKELDPIADKLVEAWNGGDLDLLDSIFDPNFVRTVNQMPDAKGVDGYKDAIIGFRTAYPDLNLSIDNEIFADNSMAVRWVLTGTNTGPGDMPPTGKSVNIWGESIIHLANGKMTKEIVAYDEKSFFEQLGFTITPPSAEMN
jgi:predicted ester cyclase